MDPYINTGLVSRKYFIGADDDDPGTNVGGIAFREHLTPRDIAISIPNERYYCVGGKDEGMPDPDNVYSSATITFATHKEGRVLVAQVTEWQINEKVIDTDDPVQYVFEIDSSLGEPRPDFYLRNPASPAWSPSSPDPHPVVTDVIRAVEDMEGNLWIEWLEGTVKGRLDHEHARYKIYNTETAFAAVNALLLGERDTLPCDPPDHVPLAGWASATIKFWHILDTGVPPVLAPPLQRFIEVTVRGEYEDEIVAYFKDDRYDPHRWSRAGEEQDHLDSAPREHRHKPLRTMRWPYEMPDNVPWVLGETIEHTYRHGLQAGDNDYVRIGADQWYLLTHRRTTVSHVNAELQLAFPTVNPQTWTWQALSMNSGNSDVGLFLRLDQYQNITDRIIVKPTVRSIGEIANEDTRRSIEPRELFLHKRLMELDRIDSFVELRHLSFHHTNEMPYYLYLEFAPYGTLGSLLKNIEKERKQRESFNSFMADAVRANLAPPPGPAPLLPELFIWLAFQSLIDACTHMNTDDKLYHDEAYIHVDIKPDNIFLMPPSDRYPTFPVVQLADFGLYARLWREQCTQMSGTHGFLAPEQYGHYPGSYKRTDIFQIGIVISCLMHGTREGLWMHARRGLPDGENTKKGWKHERRRLRDKYPHADHYSKALHELVDACLRVDQRARPSFRLISHVIYNNIDTIHDRDGNGAGGEQKPVWPFQREEFVRENALAEELARRGDLGVIRNPEKWENTQLRELRERGRRSWAPDPDEEGYVYVSEDEQEETVRPADAAPPPADEDEDEGYIPAHPSPRGPKRRRPVDETDEDGEGPEAKKARLDADIIEAVLAGSLPDFVDSDEEAVAELDKAVIAAAAAVVKARASKPKPKPKPKWRP